MHIDKRILVDLAQHFDSIKERFDFFRSIDTALLRDDLPFDQFFPRVAENIRKLLNVKSASAFVVLKDGWLPVRQTETPEFEINKYTPDLTPDQVKNGHILLQKNWPGPELNMTLFIPVELHPEAAVILAVQDDSPTPEASVLALADTKSYAEIISNQVAIMVRQRSKEQLASSKDRLVSTFLENQLMTHRCWRALVDHAASFLPDWAPLKIEPPPRVQVLTYTIGAKFILLRATQSAEKLEGDQEQKLISLAQSVPLKVEETVCGALIQKQLDVLYVNPLKDEEYKKRYKAFLFGAGHPESELVLPIRRNGEIIGLLNLEHPLPKVFTDYHIALLKEVSEFLSPFVMALVSEEKSEHDSKISLMYAMNKLLSRMAWAYHHKTSQLFLKSIGWLDMLKVALETQKEDPQQLLAELTGFVKDLQVKTRTFLEDVPDYVKNKKIDVREEVMAALKEFDPDASVQAGEIIIDFRRPQKSYQVFASHMLREHIYNVVRNSCDAIVDALAAKKIEEGKVTIEISKEYVADANNRKMSTPQVIITITDNGGGVESHLLPEIVKCDFSTKRPKGGTGCGLTAAIEYMHEIGGNLELKNDYGKGLTVELVMQEFAPDYHQLLMERQKGEQS